MKNQRRLTLSSSHRQRSLRGAIESLEGRQLLTNTPWNLVSQGNLTQNWDNAGLITASNDWSGVPSIEGYDGVGITSGTDVDPTTRTAATPPGALNVNPNVTTSPNTYSTGGVTELALTTPIVGSPGGATTGNNTVALQGSNGAPAPYLKFYINSTGTSGVRVKYDLIDIDAGNATSTQRFALQFRTSDTALWTNVFTAPTVAGDVGATSGKQTTIDAVLPATAGNQAALQIRVITTDAAGSDQLIAVENIVISATTVSAPGTLGFNPATYTVAEGVGTFNVTVKRTAGTTGLVSAAYTLVNGTATGGNDFVAASGTVSFADGVDTATIPVTILQDTLVEGSEAFTLTLTSPTGGAGVDGVAASVTITDDDVAAAGTFTFGPTAYTVNEGAGTVTLTVVRSGGTAGAVDVLYQTNDGTAVSPGDYTGTTSGTVSFADGDTTATVIVPIINDTLIESTETFAVTLLSANNGGTIGTAATATVSITDNDSGGTLAFNPTTYTVNELAGTVSLTVKRTNGTSGAVTVAYATADGTGITGAVSPGDYTATSGTVTFADGIATATIVIPIVNDALTEPSETFTVVLSTPGGGATLGSATTATVTITDSDSVAPTGLLINELYVDPAGTNAPYQFLELRGTPGAVLGEVYLLAVEGDSPSNPGTLDGIINLNGATIGSNGLLVVVASVGGFSTSLFDPATGVFGTPFFNSTGTGATNFETGSNSYVLIYRDPTSGALPALGTDLDADNTQVQSLAQNLGLEGLNAASNVTTLDAIGAPDGGASDVVYGAQLVAPSLSASIDAIERFDGNVTTLNPNAFYFGALAGSNTATTFNAFTTDAAGLSANFPTGGAVTPGNANVPAATGDTLPPTVVGATFNPLVAQAVTVVFSEDVRNTSNGVVASDFRLTNTTSSAQVALVVTSISGDGKTVTLGFANTGGLTDSILLDGSYAFTVRAGQIADLAGNTLVADANSTFRFLNADFNNDNAVGFPDLLALAQNYDPNGSGKTFAQGDANYDGVVNFADLLAVAQRYGNSGGLTAAAALVAAITGEPVKAATTLAPRKATASELVADATPVKASTFASAKRIA